MLSSRHIITCKYVNTIFRRCMLNYHLFNHDNSFQSQSTPHFKVLLQNKNVFLTQDKSFFITQYTQSMFSLICILKIHWHDFDIHVLDYRISTFVFQFSFCYNSFIYSYIFTQIHNQENIFIMFQQSNIQVINIVSDGFPLIKFYISIGLLFTMLHAIPHN